MPTVQFAVGKAHEAKVPRESQPDGARGIRARAYLIFGAAAATFVAGGMAIERIMSRPAREVSTVERGPGVGEQPAKRSRSGVTRPSVTTRSQESEAVTPAPPHTADDETKLSDEADAIVDDLVSQVESELRDSAWSREMESRVRASVDQVATQGSGITVETVQCGSTRCIVKGGATTRRGFRGAARQLRTVPGLTRGKIRMRKLAGGAVDFRVVLAREGFDIYGDEASVQMVNEPTK